jgi:hypothetical protein
MYIQLVLRAGLKQNPRNKELGWYCKCARNSRCIIACSRLQSENTSDVTTAIRIGSASQQIHTYTTKSTHLQSERFGCFSHYITSSVLGKTRVLPPYRKKRRIVMSPLLHQQPKKADTRSTAHIIQLLLEHYGTSTQSSTY